MSSFAKESLLLFLRNKDQETIEVNGIYVPEFVPGFRTAQYENIYEWEIENCYDYFTGEKSNYFTDENFKKKLKNHVNSYLKKPAFTYGNNMRFSIILNCGDNKIENIRDDLRNRIVKSLDKVILKCIYELGFTNISSMNENGIYSSFEYDYHGDKIRYSIDIKVKDLFKNFNEHLITKY